MRFLLCLLFGLLVQIIASLSAPVIIGHRGASGYRPENTLASWEAAIHFGADFVEADIVSTKDHVLVASHNPVITRTTDVSEHPEFLSRFRTRNVSGEVYEGYFVDDFTMAELKTLRVRESYNFRDQSWNDLYSIATLQEFLSFIRAMEKDLNKKIGIYLETKHPSYYRNLGLPLEEKLVETLNNFGYKNEEDNVYIESFESNLKYLRKLTKLPLTQLISGTEGDYAQFDTQRPWHEFSTVEGIEEIATYAQVVSPHKSCILRSANGRRQHTSFVDDAHRAGLKIHVWTFRKEKEHFEQEHDEHLFQTMEDEMKTFLELGIDGLFTDQPDIGIEVRNKMLHHSSSVNFNESYLISALLSALAILSLYRLSRLSSSKKIQLVIENCEKEEEDKSEMSNSF